MEPEPLGKALGEQLRMLRVQRLQMLAEALWVGHAGLVMLKCCTKNVFDPL
jgi:hypothetical protein